MYIHFLPIVSQEPGLHCRVANALEQLQITEGQS